MEQTRNSALERVRTRRPIESMRSQPEAAGSGSRIQQATTAEVWTAHAAGRTQGRLSSLPMRRAMRPAARGTPNRSR